MSGKRVTATPIHEKKKISTKKKYDSIYSKKCEMLQKSLHNSSLLKNLLKDNNTDLAIELEQAQEQIRELMKDNFELKNCNNVLHVELLRLRKCSSLKSLNDEIDKEVQVRLRYCQKKFFGQLSKLDMLLQEIRKNEISEDESYPDYLCSPSQQDFLKNLTFSDGIELLTDNHAGIVEDDCAGIVEDDCAGIVEDDGTDIVEDDGTDIVEDDGTDIVEDDGTDIVEDDGTDIVEDDGLGKVEDDGIGKVEDDGIGKVEDDGIGKVEDDGIGKVEDDGIGKVEDDGIGIVEDDGIGKVEDDSTIIVEDDGIGKVEDDGAGIVEDNGNKVEADERKFAEFSHFMLSAIREENRASRSSCFPSTDDDRNSYVTMREPRTADHIDCEKEIKRSSMEIAGCRTRSLNKRSMSSCKPLPIESEDEVCESVVTVYYKPKRSKLSPKLETACISQLQDMDAEELNFSDHKPVDMSICKDVDSSIKIISEPIAKETTKTKNIVSYSNKPGNINFSVTNECAFKKPRKPTKGKSTLPKRKPRSKVKPKISPPTSPISVFDDMDLSQLNNSVDLVNPNYGKHVASKKVRRQSERNSAVTTAKQKLRKSKSVSICNTTVTETYVIPDDCNASLISLPREDNNVDNPYLALEDRVITRKTPLKTQSVISSPVLCPDDRLLPKFREKVNFEDLLTDSMLENIDKHYHPDKKSQRLKAGHGAARKKSRGASADTHNQKEGAKVNEICAVGPTKQVRKPLKDKNENDRKSAVTFPMLRRSSVRCLVAPNSSPAKMDQTDRDLLPQIEPIRSSCGGNFPSGFTKEVANVGEPYIFVPRKQEHKPPNDKNVNDRKKSGKSPIMRRSSVRCVVSHDSSPAKIDENIRNLLPPNDHIRSSCSTGGNSSSSFIDDNQDRTRRKRRGAVKNYKEPKLGTKLRRGDKPFG